MTEEMLVNYASHAKNPQRNRMLCTTGQPSFLNGGTSCEDRQGIMRAFGLESNIERCSVHRIAERVEEGRGVIISVNADVLYYGAPLGIGSNHAVAVTATKRDAGGNLLGFFICDSNDGPSDYYPAYTIEQALTRDAMNVTSIILR